MKPEFSEILLPPSATASSQDIDGKNHQNCPILPPTYTIGTCTVSSKVNSKFDKNYSGNMNRWFGLSTILLAICLCILIGTLLFRYETKFIEYEERMSSLELELDTFYRKLEESAGSSGEDDDGMEDLFLHHNYEEMAEINPAIDSESDEAIVELVESPDEEIQTSDNFGKLRTELNLDNLESQLKELKLRRKRQIPVPHNPDFNLNLELERTEDGVIIAPNSYLDQVAATQATLTSGFAKNDPKDSTGLRIYEGLVATGGRNEPKSVDFVPDHGSGVRPYHRQSAAWSDNNRSRPSQLVKSADGLYYHGGSGGGPQFAEDVQSTNQQAVPGSRSSSAAILGSGIVPQAPVYTRSSRVAQTEDRPHHAHVHSTRASYPIRQTYTHPPVQRIGVGDREVAARIISDRDTENDVDDFSESNANFDDGVSAHAESRRYSGGGHSRGRHQGQGQGGHGQRHQTNRRYSDFSVVRTEASAEGQKSIAAHYVADVSNYTLRHRHYEGNGRLRNVDGIFEAWKPADWMADTNSNSKSFSLSSSGVLTVRQSGLYFIYAQIHYLDEHDTNSYLVQINTEPFLQCTTMTETYRGEIPKSNSCHTSGIAFLRENDRIVIKDIETSRYSIFKPEKSFFGLMKI